MSCLIVTAVPGPTRDAAETLECRAHGFVDGVARFTPRTVRMADADERPGD